MSYRKVLKPSVLAHLVLLALLLASITMVFTCSCPLCRSDNRDLRLEAVAYGTYWNLYHLPERTLSCLKLEHLYSKFDDFYSQWVDDRAFNLTYWLPSYMMAMLIGLLFGRYLHPVSRYVYIVLLAGVIYCNPGWHLWEFDALFVMCNLIVIAATLLGLLLRYLTTRKRIAWYEYIDSALIGGLIILGNLYCTPMDL